MGIINAFKSFIKNKIIAFFRRVKKSRRQRKEKSKNYHTRFKPYVVKIVHTPIKNRQKILHVVANFWTGGSSRLVIDLVEHLGHLYEQEVITMDVPKVAGYTGIPIVLIKEKEGPEKILSELNRFKPDLVHVHYLGHHGDKWGEKDWRWYRMAFEAIESYGCKVIENINIPTDPYISESVTHYVYVSKYVLDKHSVPHLQNRVVYPGSDFKHFSNPAMSHLPVDCIGMVYRLERDKINEASIDVFINVVKRRKGTKALIVGGGSLLELYKQKVADAGLTDAFHFTGYVAYDDLPQYYKKMSVFVAPIHNESFGQVTPFAMHMGIPVAAYDIGALSEIIDDNALLAPGGNADALADIIIDLLDNPARRLEVGRKNHQRALELFSVEAMIKAYKEIYSGVLVQSDRV